MHLLPDNEVSSQQLACCCFVHVVYSAWCMTPVHVPIMADEGKAALLLFGMQPATWLYTCLDCMKDVLEVLKIGFAWRHHVSCVVLQLLQY